MYSSLHYLQTHHEMEPLDEKQPKLIEKSRKLASSLLKRNDLLIIAVISDETGLFKGMES